MGNRRLGLALLAALAISTVITGFFYFRFARQQGRPLTKRVIAAAVALQPGVPVAAESLTEINWPEGVPLEGLIEKKEDVAGHVLAYAVPANQPVLKHDLASSGSFGLAAKIPDGMRATAVKTDEVSSLSGFIFPGSHVDVLVTLRPANSSESSITRTVLQNVQVLSAGAKMEPDPNGKPEKITVVTLLVTPEQSEKVALAQTQGTLQFVLRNGSDLSNPETPSVDMAQLTGTAKAAPPPVEKNPRALRVVSPKPPEAVKALPKIPIIYTVETIANGKTSVAQFPEKSE